LETIQLGVPKITKFAANLERRGFVFERLPVTIKEFAEVMSHG
jgi:energy-coupling factor transport system ATP-binding protein